MVPGVSFPSNWKDAKQVKKNVCQENGDKIAEDMEKCGGKLTEKQEEEEEKTEKCMKTLLKVDQKILLINSLINSLIESI